MTPQRQFGQYSAALAVSPFIERRFLNVIEMYLRQQIFPFGGILLRKNARFGSSAAATHENKH